MVGKLKRRGRQTVPYFASEKDEEMKVVVKSCVIVIENIRIRVRDVLYCGIEGRTLNLAISALKTFTSYMYCTDLLAALLLQL